MKTLRNEKGFALGFVLILAAIALTMTVAMLLMVGRGSFISGQQKRFRTAVEATRGGMEAMLQLISSRGNPTTPYTNQILNAGVVTKMTSVTDAWAGLDTMQTGGRTRERLAAHPGLRALKVDVVGVGSGVADRLRELKYPVVDVNVGAGARDPKRFVNLRCELWWGLRERVRQGLLAGPIAEATIGQLATVRYSYDGTHTGPVIESKEQARKRGVKSPDRAEALLLAFAQVGPRPPTLAAPVSLTRRSPWTLE